MGMIRDSFVMFKTWAESIDALPEEYQLETYRALTKYGLTGKVPEDTSAVVRAILISFSKGMENNIARYQASVSNGKKGGRPKKNQEEPSSEIKNLAKPSKTQEKQSEPTRNLNVDDNVNVYVNDNIVVDDIFNNCVIIQDEPLNNNINRDLLIEKIKKSEYLKNFEKLKYSWLNQHYEEILSGKYDDFAVNKKKEQKFESRNYTESDFNNLFDDIDDIDEI